MLRQVGGVQVEIRRKNMCDIKLDRNYKNILDGKIFTGQQILNLLVLSSPPMQAIILLSIQETDEPADKPKLRYGV